MRNATARLMSMVTPGDYLFELYRKWGRSSYAYELKVAKCTMLVSRAGRYTLSPAWEAGFPNVGVGRTFAGCCQVARRKLRGCTRDAFAPARSNDQKRKSRNTRAVGVDRNWRARFGKRRLGICLH